MTTGDQPSQSDSPTSKLSIWQIALAVGTIVLVVGLVQQSTIWKVVGILIFMASAVYAFVALRGRVGNPSDGDGDGSAAHSSPTSSDGTMKTLLFDDFQGPNDKYVVKEMEEEEGVVPSTKTARPVSMAGKAESARTLDIPDFFDMDLGANYPEVEPRNEFHSLLNKVLLVLKDVLFAHSVAFFWANNEKRQMILEAMAADPDHFMKEKRFAMDQDLISRVAATGKPQILGRMNPSSELELLRYYESSAGIQSVLAVPVFFMNTTSDISPVGVIVADSKAEDQFGTETLALVGRFTKLVSAFVKSYTDKYELLLDSELLASLRRMHDRIGNVPTEEGVLSAVADETNRLATWDHLTFVLYSEEQGGWVINRVTGKGALPYVGQGLIIDAQASIVGNVISSNEVKVVDLKGDGDQVRFHSAEPQAAPGSFLCVPISSFNRCYGVLTLESRIPGNYKGSEPEKIYRLVQSAASILEVVYLNDIVREQLPVDQQTGALTTRYFESRAEEEVQRATDLSAELSFANVEIDHFKDIEARYGKTGVDAVLGAVGRLLKANTRPYDAVGRLGTSRLGVLLVHTVANDAYLWAEKFRKKIAGQVIQANETSFSVTVSVGICGLLDGMTTRELSSGSEKVLARAVENGGNLVRVQ